VTFVGVETVTIHQILDWCYELESCRPPPLGTLLRGGDCMDYWNGMWPIYSLRRFMKDKFGSKNNKKTKEVDEREDDSPP